MGVSAIGTQSRNLMMTVDDIDGRHRGKFEYSFESTGFCLTLSVENERADAGLDGRTRLAGLNSQARTGIGKQIFSLIHLTTSRIGHHSRLIHILLNVLTIHRRKTFLLRCLP